MAQSNEQGGFGELDKALLGFRGGYGGHSLESIRQLILADRKQHELDARIDELISYGREVGLLDSRVKTALHERIEKLKAERL